MEENWCELSLWMKDKRLKGLPVTSIQFTLSNYCRIYDLPCCEYRLNAIFLYVKILLTINNILYNSLSPLISDFNVMKILEFFCGLIQRDEFWKIFFSPLYYISSIKSIIFFHDMSVCLSIRLGTYIRILLCFA